MASPLRLDLPASADVVADARKAVAEYAERVGVRDTLAVAVAVSEAVTSVVVHASGHVEGGRVSITADRPPDDGLVVTVEDAGTGVKPRQESRGLGLGLSLAAEMADTFQLITPPGGGTRVRMSFAA